MRRYTKLFWINSGPHNAVTARKQLLRLTTDEWVRAVTAAGDGGAPLVTRDGESPAQLAARLAPVVFDPAVDPILTQKTPGEGRDILESSANNLYVGVSMRDLDGFAERFALNSRLVKTADGLVEEVCRIGGRYDREIRRIVRHLEDALAVCAGSHGGGAAGADPVLHAPATTPTAWPTTSPGCATTPARWTP